MLTNDKLAEMEKDALKLAQGYHWTGLENTVAWHVKDLVDEVSRLNAKLRAVKGREYLQAQGGNE